VTARKCSESHECASSVSSAPVLVSVASSPVCKRRNTASTLLMHGAAPLDKPTADQHTPLNTGHGMCMSLAQRRLTQHALTQQPITACMASMAQASLLPWMQPCGLLALDVRFAAQCRAASFLPIFCHPLTACTCIASASARHLIGYLIGVAVIV
jgi:hypothetical protein